MICPSDLHVFVHDTVKGRKDYLQRLTVSLAVVYVAISLLSQRFLKAPLNSFPLFNQTFCKQQVHSCSLFRTLLDQILRVSQYFDPFSWPSKLGPDCWSSFLPDFFGVHPLPIVFGVTNLVLTTFGNTISLASVLYQTW